MTQQEGPKNFIEFIFAMIKGMIAGIPGMIRWMIISIIISAALANGIHLYILGWINDGWNPSSNQTLNAMMFVNGQQYSPKVMLFYFTLSYLFWWLLGQFRSKGIGTTIKLIVTTPIWIINSLREAGFAAFPMLMLGIATSFILGLVALTGPTSLQMFLMMITMLIAQEESLMVFGLQLGFKDVSGLVSRGSAQMPSKALPVMAIVGAGMGFGYMTFFNSDPFTIGVFAALTVAGLIYMFIRNRNANQAALMALMVLIIAGTALIPSVLGDDGGIRENGGWNSLAQGWLRDQLISRGYPASIASGLAAMLAAMFSSPQVLSEVAPLGDGYVERDWTRITTDGRADAPTRWIEDPNGGWETPDGRKWRREQGGTGLSETIIDAEDNENLGNRVRVYTMEPPKDQGLINEINEGIENLDRFYVDRLHPDNWKDLTPGQRGVVLQQVSEVLKNEMGLDYTLELYSNPKRPGLGGSFSPSRNRIKLNTSGRAFNDPRTAIRTIIHEARHAYQDIQANATGSSYQQMCNYNNSNYTTSRHDYVRYAEQFIERDSRNFGHNATNNLIGRLNNVWRGN